MPFVEGKTLNGWGVLRKRPGISQGCSPPNTPLRRKPRSAARTTLYGTGKTARGQTISSGPRGRTQMPTGPKGSAVPPT
jgi:hypothetical protein